MAGKRRAADAHSPGGQQHARTFGKRGAGGDDIVDKQDPLTAHRVRASDNIAAGDVRPALLRSTQPGLRRNVARFAQQRHSLRSKDFRRRFREKLRLRQWIGGGLTAVGLLLCALG